ncbi:MAG TPA: isochorismatase family protein [Myxococcota bacterium]|nr:isochorismatase family protein [Myxococcota bacterium]
MALDLAALCDPAHTALVTQECQKGVIGKSSSLPGLAEGVARVGMVENASRLARAARAAGVRVVHCTAERRADGLGANRNARLFQYMAKAKTPLLPGSDAVRLVPELGPEPGDLVLARLHGLSPFQGTELDFVLRNEGVTTIVAVGVSINVAIQNFAFDAVNASYQMVIPRDAVAGFPAEYVEQVFTHTLGAIATLTTTDELLAAWARRR